MKIIHRSGKHHSNADGLSRIPDPEFSCDCYSAGRDLDSLPCGGCAFCRRAHEQWARFADDVDDVVPLAMDRLLPVETESPEIRQVSATPPDGNLQSNPCSSPNCRDATHIWGKNRKTGNKYSCHQLPFPSYPNLFRPTSPQLSLIATNGA